MYLLLIVIRCFYDKIYGKLIVLNNIPMIIHNVIHIIIQINSYDIQNAIKRRHEDYVERFHNDIIKIIFNIACIVYMYIMYNAVRVMK